MSKVTLIKAITYRLYSSLITFVIAYIFTHNVLASFSIGLLDSAIKILSYYYFDTLWARFTGIKPKPAVIWLTGLSGAGKTTIANGLAEKLKRHNIVPVMLDGDEIRHSIRLTGFDEASRKRHNLNVGFMASVLEKQGNLVIVSLISPYADVRNEIRALCVNFIEVFVSTDLEVCMRRDPKGLYKKALSGEIDEFTGISAPYQVPGAPEVILDTTQTSVAESVDQLLSYIVKR